MLPLTNIVQRPLATGSRRRPPPGRRANDSQPTHGEDVFLPTTLSAPATTSVARSSERIAFGRILRPVWRSSSPAAFAGRPGPATAATAPARSPPRPEAESDRHAPAAAAARDPAAGRGRRGLEWRRARAQCAAGAPARSSRRRAVTLGRSRPRPRAPTCRRPFPSASSAAMRAATTLSHIHAAPVAGSRARRGDLVGHDDAVGAEFVWAALDCPGAYAIMAARPGHGRARPAGRPRRAHSGRGRTLRGRRPRTRRRRPQARSGDGALHGCGRAARRRRGDLDRAALAGGGRGDRLERLRVLERREVAGVGAERRRAHGTTHDLRRARLRQRVDEDHAARRERLAEPVGDDVPISAASASPGSAPGSRQQKIQDVSPFTG